MTIETDTEKPKRERRTRRRRDPDAPRRERKPRVKRTTAKAVDRSEDSGDFSSQLTWRMNECIEKAIEKGYIYQRYLDDLKKNNPLIRPDHIKAAVLRKEGLKNFKFYLEVLTDFPIDRNNKRIIIDANGNATEHDGKSVYRHLCDMLEHREKNKNKYMQFAIPRDLMKTTFFTRYMGWLYLRDTIVNKRAPIIMFLCHKKDFAMQNLNLCMKVLNDDLLRTLYQDVLQSEISKSSEVRFTLPGVEYSRQIKRKESHFMTGGAEMSFESQHCTYIYCDDWCTWENCSSAELTQQNIAAYHKLDFLNDNSGLFTIFNTCTMHYDDDMNARFIEQDWGPCLCVGAEELRDDGTIIYNFPENPDYTPESIALYRKKHDAQSVNGNILMVPSKRRTAITITDTLPDWQDPFKLEQHDPIRHCAITLDPAFSMKRKKEGCLQAMLVLINTQSGKLYVYDGSLGRNLSPMKTIDRISVYIKNYNAKELIIETNAMQGWIATSIHEQLQNRGVDNAVMLTSAFNSRDKIDSISAFLEPIIARGKLFVSPSLPEVINEIYGKSRYIDGVDALSFARFSRFFDLSDPPPRTELNDEEAYRQEQEYIRNLAHSRTGIHSVCPWIE